MRGLGSALAVTVENRAAVGKDFLCGAARSWAGFNRSQAGADGRAAGNSEPGALGMSGARLAWWRPRRF